MSIDKTPPATVIKPTVKPRGPVILQRDTSPAPDTRSPAPRINLRKTQQMLHCDNSQDIRQSRVDEIRQALAEGSYQTDSSAIARGIAGSLLRMESDAD
ncbi:flagellar biosynthesis anti-sigma factor FlgM [Tatumella citrea]|uniref:Negative regulator of flagellin synthesis n=1 Tax=Tatumella citrea TaxID=53336 RepID=A0A1Y0L6F2_TATCI|nr:flagellar biosynthesis anti-sigma factor FlgM [Tatumella citrea]ARU93624.1 flagellar biosynthesis anti-sigma factor FlgM [Tatumella citrea]ARU97662.1 flagellar biosynthesis anti-sigma factor FlgM [Tatumella citrea]